MQRLRSSLLCVLIGTFPLSTLATTIAAPVIPEERLDQAGLERDIISLISYLEHGFDEPSFQASSHYRFYYYNFVIGAIENLGDPQAIPALRRIQAGDLAPIMSAELDVYIATSEDLTSWEDWDLYRELLCDRTTMLASLAIWKLSAESPLPILEALLEKRRQLIDSLGNENLRQYSYGLFVELCRNVSIHGSRSGIDAMIAFLETPHARLRNRAASQLRRWTRLWHGPYSDSPFSTVQGDVHQWKDWWLANRPNANTSHFYLGEPQEAPLLPAVATLHGHLWRSVEGRYGRAELSGQESRYWLQEHAAEYSRELRTVATDPTERLEIRAAALRYFTGSNRASSYRLLIRCLQDTAVAENNPLYQTSLDILKGYYRDRYDDVLKACVENEWPSAQTALYRLASDPYERVYTMKVLPTLSRHTQPLILNVLLYAEPPSVAAVEYALAGDHKFSAAKALRLARDPAIQSKLSASALINLAKWKEDSECHLMLMRIAPPSELQPKDFTDAMEALTSDDPRAAAIYKIAMKHLGGEQATEGLVHSIEAYRVSRGRTETLSELGFK